MIWEKENTCTYNSKKKKKSLCKYIQFDNIYVVNDSRKPCPIAQTIRHPQIHRLRSIHPCSHSNLPHYLFLRRLH